LVCENLGSVVLVSLIEVAFAVLAKKELSDTLEFCELTVSGIGGQSKEPMLAIIQWFVQELRKYMRFQNFFFLETQFA
jgi:hypothetical protein